MDVIKKIKMQYTNEQIYSIFKSLPLEIKEVITSVEYTDGVRAIGKKYKLMIDRVGDLSEETWFVLMGITPSKNFTKNIQKRLGISEDVAVNIAKDINEKIFSAVRESLKKIFEKRDAEGGSLLGKTGGKAEEEILNREDILREIEDKEHHNLPTVNKQELHLEASPPSEIGAQVSFQNQKMADSAKRDKPAEMIVIRPEQPQRQPAMPQGEAMKTMKGDIFKNKMSGIVNMPRETIEINDAKTPAKKLPSDISNKIDPYREKIGK